MARKFTKAFKREFFVEADLVFDVKEVLTQCGVKWSRKGWYNAEFLVGFTQETVALAGNEIVPVLYEYDARYALPGDFDFVELVPGKGLFTYKGCIFNSVFFYDLSRYSSEFASYYLFVPEDSMVMVFPPHSQSERWSQIYTPLSRDEGMQVLIEQFTQHFCEWGVCPTDAPVYRPFNLDSMTITWYIEYLLERFDIGRASTPYLIFSALHNYMYDDFVRYNWVRLVNEVSNVPASSKYVPYGAMVQYSEIYAKRNKECPLMWDTLHRSKS